MAKSSIMGRGLSKLQRFILITAATTDRYKETKGRIYNTDIFEGFYGWRTNGAQRFGSKCFDPKEIGQKKYDAAHVAVRKACDRLNSRGLVVCLNGRSAHWAGLEITDKGREVATALMAKSRPESGADLANS